MRKHYARILAALRCGFNRPGQHNCPYSGHPFVAQDIRCIAIVADMDS